MKNRFFLLLLLVIILFSNPLGCNFTGAETENGLLVVEKDVSHGELNSNYWFHSTISLQVSSTIVNQDDIITATCTISYVRLDGKVSGFSGARIELGWGDATVVSMSPSYKGRTINDYRTINGTYFGVTSVDWLASEQYYNPPGDYHSYRVGFNSPTTFSATFRLNGQNYNAPWIRAYGYEGLTATINLKLANDLSVDDAKLVQVVKDPKTLIMNKNATICVNVTSTFREPVNAEIEVRYNFGKIYVEKGRDGKGVPIQPGKNTIYIPGGPATPGDSVPWMMPNEGDYLVWTRTGTDDGIRVVIDPGKKTPDTNLLDNTFLISKKVEESKNLKILIVPVYFPGLSERAYAVDFRSQMESLRRLYPVSENQFSWKSTRAISWPFNPPIGATKEKLYDWLYNEVATPITSIAMRREYDKVVIVLPTLSDLPPLSPTMSGFFLGTGRPQPNSVAVFVNNEAVSRTRVTAHEIGHSYHLWHPFDLGPHTGNNVVEYDVEARIYGNVVPNFMSETTSTSWIDEGRYESNLLEPLSFKDSKGKTITVYSWNLESQLTSGTDPEVCIATGAIFNNSTATVDDPWYITDSDAVDLGLDTRGNYSLVMLNAAGMTLGRVGFNSSFTYGYEDENGTIVEGTSEVAPFVFRIPHINGTKVVELRDNSENVLAVKTMSANAPSVKIKTPSEGETFTVGDECKITWDSSDPDGDNLSYVVSYNLDEGASWVPVALNIKERSFTWNTTGLPEGGYKLLVEANDGFNTVGSTLETIRLSRPEGATTLNCNVSSNNTNAGDTVTIYGSINPPGSGASVKLTITSPSGNLSTMTLVTSADGGYSYSFKPQDKGVWTAQASWSSSTAKVTWTVQTPTTTLHRLTVYNPDGSGTTDPVSGSYTYHQKVTVKMTAKPSTGWKLDHWLLDDINIGSVNQYIINMNTNHTIKAIFTPTQTQSTPYVLTIQPSEGQGVTDPITNTYSYNKIVTVPVKATPAIGWTFHHWELDGIEIGNANPYIVNMNANHKLKAFFVSSSETGSSSGIPGYPVEAITFGFIIYLVCIYYIQMRK